MKINGEDDLRNVLGRAFSAYANELQNGATQEFASFLEGQESVNVKVTLNPDGTIKVERFEMPVQESPPQVEAPPATPYSFTKEPDPTVIPLEEEPEIPKPAVEDKPKRSRKKTE